MIRLKLENPKSELVEFFSPEASGMLWEKNHGYFLEMSKDIFPGKPSVDIAEFHQISCCVAISKVQTKYS